MNAPANTTTDRISPEEWVKHWADIAWSTAPADPLTAESAVMALYDLCELPRPTLVLHVASPYAAYRAIAEHQRSDIDNVLHEIRSTFQIAKLERALFVGFLLSKIPSRDTAQELAYLRRRIEGRRIPRDEAISATMYARSHISDTPVILRCDRLATIIVNQAIQELSVDRTDRELDSGYREDVWRTAAWASYRHEILRKLQVPETEILIKLLRSCGWFAFGHDIAAISDRPQTIQRDANGLLHADTGPAVRYADGWSIYAIHGVRVPGWLIENPEQLNCAHIDNETNSEARRVMIDRYGIERYLTESGADLVDECPAEHPIVGLRTARLLVKTMVRDEPIAMLDMLNSTPEPDGTTKRYLIRIDPRAYEGEAATSCLAAMASTYRLPDGTLLFNDYRDYAPAFES